MPEFQNDQTRRQRSSEPHALALRAGAHGGDHAAGRGDQPVGTRLRRIDGGVVG